jgi:hypothetical protein
MARRSQPTSERVELVVHVRNWELSVLVESDLNLSQVLRRVRAECTGRNNKSRPHANERECDQARWMQRLWRLLSAQTRRRMHCTRGAVFTNEGVCMWTQRSSSCAFLAAGGGRFCRLISTFPALAHGKEGDLRSSGARGRGWIMSGSDEAADERLRVEQEDWQVFQILCSADNANASILHVGQHTAQ